MSKRMMSMAAYGVLAGSLAIHALLFWDDRTLIAKGYPDFTIFYSAGLMIRQGLGHQLYDETAQYAVQRQFASGVVIRHGALPFNHPPFEALIFLPLTFLPYLTAYIVWNLLNLGMLALVTQRLRPHIAILRSKPLAVWVLGLLTFFPISFALLQGQDVILLFLFQTLAFVALKKKSDFLAGCWLGMGSFKYHLILPLVVMIWLGWKRIGVLWGFFGACLGLGAISVTLVGWKEAFRYPGYVLHLEKVMGGGAILPASMPNLRGLVEGWRDSAGTMDAPHIATIVLSISLLMWAVLVSRKYLSESMELRFALAATVAVLISYHTFAYDLVLLAIPLFTALDLLFSAPRVAMKWGLSFWIPAALLWFTPLYALLSFRMFHMSLFGGVLVFWLWGIQQRLASTAQLRRDESIS
ncbi:MAG TPA: glycosyltransferase family 87 protein [Candidatus Sulfotelmatobacter sp.]